MSEPVYTQKTSPDTARDALGRVRSEVGKAVVGQDAAVTGLVIALLCRGHVLLEGVPGVAKTLLVRALSASLSLHTTRVQFTPDLMPGDVTGSLVYDARTAEFSFREGPVFTNLLLADEINRAPAKVQSALLEVMQEHQVTIGRETHHVPEPFLVLATQNPIETEGTYALPEAQVDRFMLKVLVDYPNDREELVIVDRMAEGLARPRQIISTEELMDLQQQADGVYVDPELKEYVVRLVGATRNPGAFGASDIGRYLSFGASPRASINLVLGARALALLRGRDYVVSPDIADLAPDVLRHRLVLSYEALADNVTPDAVINRVMEVVPRPARPLTDEGWKRPMAGSQPTAQEPEQQERTA